MTATSSKQKSRKIFVIDFDSTLVKLEALDELAAIALRNVADGPSRMAQIQELTNLGMEGKLSFPESLHRRIQLLCANRKHLDELVKRLKKNITPSFKGNKEFLRKHANNIYVMTGGFYDYVVPVIKSLGLKESNVYANSFEFDRKGNIVGFDTNRLLAQEEGKVKQLAAIKLEGEVHVVGDGYSDYQLKQSPVVKKFMALTENVTRSSVVEKADRVMKSFDEVLYEEQMPRRFSYPRSKMKALLLEGIHPVAEQVFKEQGFLCERLSGGLSEDELCDAIRDVSILGIRSKTRVSARIVESATRLMAVGAFCIGTDQIDLDSCARRGIVAFNAPYSNTRSVVELALGEIIMLLRRTFEASSSLHSGKWVKSAAGSFEVRGKKLGIVGYGNIGSQLSVLAEALGLEVFYYDIIEKLGLGNARKCRSLQELLKVCDIVTLHVDGRPTNKHLIGEAELKILKPGAILLNLSRGHVVNLSALAKYIKSGKIAGAAIDVFPVEPKNNDEKFVTELSGLPNVILTPHIGGSTSEAQHNIAAFVVEQLLEYINNGSTFSSVNFPQLQLPQLYKAHRFLHIHENVPGILAQINGILARQKINILGQYLKTNELIGYVITDVNKKYDQAVMKELKAVPHTIKFRVLY